MWINFIFVLILFFGVFIGFKSFTVARGENNSAFDELSKIDLNKSLDELEELQGINERPPGAMCYKVVSPPERAEYVCPVCGEMSLYPDYYSDIDKISYYRNLVKKINKSKKIQVELDESQLCRNCSTEYILSPELCLIVKQDENSQPKKTCGITEDDLNLLYEYSEGKPVTDRKDRLKELLCTQD